MRTVSEPTQCPAFVLSGVSSGSGKTTLALGLMAAFSRRGLKVAPFKCGPDFIDPGLHRLACGRVSRNLDLWMMRGASGRCFERGCAGADLAIIEGVMGMFDGGPSSSAALSKEFGLANILVVDVHSMAESAAAVVKGFEQMAPSPGLTGVIFNRVASPRHLQLVKEALLNSCQAEFIGALPSSLEFHIPERHLGLLTADEAPISPEALEALAATVEEHLDLDRLLSLAARSGPATATPAEAGAPARCRVAVARDRAFCFYYEDNLDLLREAGAELIEFSPINDERMPEADGLYLGGGYPELYAAQLSENRSMADSIRAHIAAGRPCFAECGGFMYLTEGLEVEGSFFPMLGHFPVRTHMNPRRMRLGYRQLSTRADSFFGPMGTQLRGHEFHYSDISAMPAGVEAIFSVENPGVGELEPEGWRLGSVVGGYMHLHFGSAPQAAACFVTACAA